MAAVASLDSIIVSRHDGQSSFIPHKFEHLRPDTGVTVSCRDIKVGNVQMFRYTRLITPVRISAKMTGHFGERDRRS